MGENGAILLLEKENDTTFPLLILDDYFEVDRLSPQFVVNYIPLDVLNEYIMRQIGDLDGDRVLALKGPLKEKYNTEDVVILETFYPFFKYLKF